MRNAKVDANQSEIVKVTRKLGASVQHLHTVGKGCPDIIVGFRGCNYLWEIKDGNKSPSKQKLNDLEVEWHLKWRGQVTVISSVNEAIAFLNEVNHASGN